MCMVCDVDVDVDVDRICMCWLLICVWMLILGGWNVRRRYLKEDTDTDCMIRRQQHTSYRTV